MFDAPLRFIHISDTHIHPDAEYRPNRTEIAPYEGARALVEQVNNLPFKPDFVLHTGDVAYDPDPEAYVACLDILGEIKYPVYYVAGNHDNNTALQQHLLGHADPARTLHYAFEKKGIQVVVLDSTGPAEPPAGSVSAYQLEWLSGLCAGQNDLPMVIAVHHNPLAVGVPWLDDYMGMTNGEDFHRTILPARDRIRVVLFGHVHQNIDIFRDGILYCSTLSSWVQYHAWPEMTHTTTDRGAEPGFSVVTVTPEQTFIRRHRYAPPR